MKKMFIKTILVSQHCSESQGLFSLFCKGLSFTDWLIRCMVFNDVFQRYFSKIAAASVPIRAFLKFYEPILRTVFFPSQWLLSLIIFVKTMDSGERGRIHVLVTIMNSWKECCLKQRWEAATSCFQVTSRLPTEVRGGETDALLQTWTILFAGEECLYLTVQDVMVDLYLHHPIHGAVFIHQKDYFSS